MLAEIRSQASEARVEGRVLWRRAQTLVGRLCNHSQIWPELRPLLRGGYAVARPGAGASGGRR
eukprot:735870-Pleurochrysis_carterae.AAC.1